MPEIKITPVTPVSVEKVCECSGFFRFMSKSTDDYPNAYYYYHKCNKCGKVFLFRCIYPYIDYMEGEVFTNSNPEEDKGFEAPEGDQDAE